jgi:integrase
MEHLPEGAEARLRKLKHLRMGTAGTREPRTVTPVDADFLEVVAANAGRVVGTMLRVQMLTGMRSSELCGMRPCDIDRDGPTWLYVPATHKTAHHGHERSIDLGPRVQEMIRSFMDRLVLKGEPEAYVFSPTAAWADYRAEQTKKRKTPASYGNCAGSKRKARPQRTPGIKYTAASYRRAVQRACDIAFPPPTPLAKIPADPARKRKAETNPQRWARLTPKQRTELRKWRELHRFHPHRVRHLFGTTVRKLAGAEAARLALGHRHLRATEIYAQPNREAVRAVALRIG